MIWRTKRLAWGLIAASAAVGCGTSAGTSTTGSTTAGEGGKSTTASAGTATGAGGAGCTNDGGTVLPVHASWPMPNPPSTGLPNPASYTSTPPVVLDDVTGLEWQEPPDAAQAMVTWSDARTYCAGLTLAGHCDWRLPSIIELFSIMDYTEASGLAPAFSAPAKSWSSTPVAASVQAGNAWTVGFGVTFGATYLEPTSSALAARCVRAGTSDSGRYFAESGTVLDPATGLTWQQAGAGADDSFSGDAAYCSANAAGLAGSGWRMPSVKELLTLAAWSEGDPAIDAATFPGTGTAYWSSSPVAGAPTFGWIVSFFNSSVYKDGVGALSGGRCVR
jgi:hypothetical protein